LWRIADARQVIYALTSLTSAIARAVVENNVTVVLEIGLA